MKKLVLSAAILSGLASGQVANAQTLEEVLRQKGVLSEQDYQAVTANPSPPSQNYKLGEGFTFTSADKKYQGSIGGFLQLRYTFTDMDEANNAPGKTVQNTSQFSMSRVKLYFNGYSLTPDLTYKLQLNVTQGNVLSTGKEIEEAYLNYRFIDEAQLRFGQDKVPFARQFLVSSSAQQFIDLSQVTTAFAPGYDAGLMLHGKIVGGLFNYNAGVYGGAGQGTMTPNTDNAIVGRIAFNPLGEFKYVESDVDNSQKPLATFGANIYSNTLKNGGTNNVNIMSSTGWVGIGTKLMPAAFATDTLDIVSGGFDAAFKWQGFYTQAEYFTGRAEGKHSHDTLYADGFYVQAGYFVLPEKLELAVRYSYLDPDRDAAKDHWVETTGGVNYYFNKHNLKLQADITDIHKQAAVAFNSGPLSTDDLRVRLQAQLLF